jgi:hypothetical protein
MTLPFSQAYEAALGAFVRNHADDADSEKSLEQAHGLGRQALADNLSVLDISELHHRTVAALVREAPSAAEAAATWEAALPFLLQSLAALDMATRGFVEAAERIAVEQQHVSHLHALAESFVDVSVDEPLNERLAQLARSGAQLLSADGAMVQLNGNDATVGDIPPRTEGFPRVEGLDTARGIWDEEEPYLYWLAAAALDGVFAVWRRTPYTAFEEAVFAQFGQLASASLSNTMLYEREHNTALTLQRSLLPASLPKTTGLVLAKRYLPSSSHSGVGGDWYDVIQLPGRRTGLVIGDVMGHGVGAAAFMGQLKVAMHAYATEGHSPSEVLDRADRLIPALGGERIATAIYAILEPDGRLVFANAGHPPPLVSGPRAERPFLLTDGLSVPLGTGIGSPARPSGEVVLEPGSTLLLYTDGLIERRDRSIDMGLEALQTLMHQPGALIDDLCDQALEAAVDQPNQDDICILAVHFP